MATARERLNSVIYAASKLQDLSDEELEKLQEPLRHADLAMDEATDLWEETNG